MDNTIRAELEEELRELPVIQYARVAKAEIPFSEKVRTICKEECPRYGKSWACPPGVGTVGECRAICDEFEGAFVFTTVAEVQDIMDMRKRRVKSVICFENVLSGRWQCQVIPVQFVRNVHTRPDRADIRRG